MYLQIKKHFNILITFRTIMAALFFMTWLIIGGGISCQSQEPSSSAPAVNEPTTTDEQPATPAVIEVTIEGFAFKPAEITIAAGSTVTWQNNDSVIHIVTAQDKLFDSGSLSNGNTFSYTFEQKGTFEYYCAVHPYMKGRVIIE
ncbi:MAG: cupredoxin family copper-binding protein [Dehalococcoidales bacterium]|nr:cupredoxin family copper-binding protein [Dehalococcoidales bacterium]